MDSSLSQESNSNLTENSDLTANNPPPEKTEQSSDNLGKSSPQHLPKKSSKFSLKKIIIIAAVLVVGVLLFTYFHDTGKSKTPTKVYKVGILDGLQTYFGGSVTGFEQGMTSLGYIQGKNITYIVKNEGLTGNQAIFKQFIRDKVNLVVTLPTEPTEEGEAVLKGSDVPLLSMDASLEGTNIINSIQKPGHNITGVRYPGPEDSVERLVILHQLAPNDTHILVPYLADYPNVPGQLAALRTEAQTLGLTLIAEPISATETSSYVSGLSASNPGFDAITTMAEPFSVTPAMNEPLYNFANLHSIPISGSSLNNNDTGPIAYVAPNSITVGQLAAPLAVKIFNGSAAGTLPILTPTSDIGINLLVAQPLGITPDQGLLSIASKVIR